MYWIIRLHLRQCVPWGRLSINTVPSCVCALGQALVDGFDYVDLLGGLVDREHRFG
jgi:hypothetical protein